MQNPVEAIKLSQRSITHTKNADAAISRVAGHINHAHRSYWKGVTNPFALSEDAAKALTEVERRIEALRVALDAAHLTLTGDIDFHLRRIHTATPQVQAELQK
jgi:poly-gamma-glutamate capsule biosynthesis protein CapA/YwtB (metallophosphatase superfamily)